MSCMGVTAILTEIQEAADGLTDRVIAEVVHQVSIKCDHCNYRQNDNEFAMESYDKVLDSPSADAYGKLKDVTAKSWT